MKSWNELKAVTKHQPINLQFLRTEKKLMVETELDNNVCFSRTKFTKLSTGSFSFVGLLRVFLLLAWLLFSGGGVARGHKRRGFSIDIHKLDTSSRLRDNVLNKFLNES